MKKFLLSTVALATMTAGAIAADLPARRMAPAPSFAAVPIFTWSGFYVGANVGATFNRHRRDNIGFGDTLSVVDVAGNNFGFGSGFVGGGGRRTNILGGVQAGFNWQMGALVLGVEGDIQAVGNSRKNHGFGSFGSNADFGTAVVGIGGVAAPTLAFAPRNVAFFNNAGGGLLGDGDRGSDWFGTARVRVGFAVDRALFYVTGGAAFKDDDNNNNNRFFGGGGGFASGAAVPAGFYVSAPAVLAGAQVGPTNNFVLSNSDNNNIGWALGLGMEYAFTNNLSAKIEYLHLAFDRDKNHGFGGSRVVGVTNTGAAITSTGVSSNRRRNEVDLVRVGLNFRFSGF